jgi:hypothetical protein
MRPSAATSSHLDVSTHWRGKYTPLRGTLQQQFMEFDLTEKSAVFVKK